MEIKIDQFCALATSPAWQAWLFRFAKPLHSELVEHLRGSRSCNSNRDKMVSIFQRLVDLPGGPEQLVAFLGKQFPHVIAARPTQTITKAALADDGVFEHYDPDLLTFPRKLIITGSDLERKVKEFLAKHAKGDYVVIGDRAYVEYLPVAHAGLASTIPAANWETTAWRSRHSQR